MKNGTESHSMDLNSEKVLVQGSEINEETAQHRLLAQSKFDEMYMYRQPLKHGYLKRVQKFGKELSLKKTCMSFFPILVWIQNYSWKKDLLHDLISGFTVAIMHIPQGMAYALLGGVPPIVGIYMAFFPVLIYVLMGTSRHVSMGTFAVVCMMTGVVVSDYSSPLPYLNDTNATIESELPTDSNNTITGYAPVEVAACVCFVVGLWQLFLGMFKLGGLSVLLSETLVSGFSTGAAVHVMTSQLKHIFGVKIKSFSGPLKIIYTYVELFKNITATNLIALAVSTVTMLLLAIFNECIKPYTRKIIPVPIPIELIAVIVGTLASMYGNFNSNYNITVVGEIPTGLPAPSLPAFPLVPNVLVPALVIAIIAFSITISMASIFARKLNYEIDGTQELLASGVSNIFGSFFMCIPFAASLSRSLIQEDVGGKTQIASIISCLFLLLILLWIGPFFEPLPNCVLAGIVLVSLKGMFVQIKDVFSIWHRSKMDGLVWLLTFFGVVVIDIDIGLAIGIALSILTVVMLGQKVKIFVFGNIPGTDIYLDVSRYKASIEIPGISILQIAGGIHFANIDYVKKKIYTILESQGMLEENKLLYVILDMACISFVDPVASKHLLSMYKELKEKNTTLYLTTCPGSVRESLIHQGFFEEFPESQVFPFIHHAIMHAQEK